MNRMKGLLGISIALLHKNVSLAEMPYWYWYSAPKEIANIENGVVPTLSCPLGTYRESGFRDDGCKPCPPGNYGSSIHLTSPSCTGACPVGTYLGIPHVIRLINQCFLWHSTLLSRPFPFKKYQSNTWADKPGGVWVTDCKPCPEGTYGDTEWLSTRECSGRCSDLNTMKTKYFGSEDGLKSRNECRVCPKDYLDPHGQCQNQQGFLERYGGKTYHKDNKNDNK